MNLNELNAVADAAKNKADIAKNHTGKYMIRAIMAGFFIVIATILSNVCAAVLLPTFPQFGKLIAALTFSLAIILVCFIGGELFTGNNMVMTVGLLNKSCNMKDLSLVYLLSYIGNFIGAFILSAVFVYSNASHSILVDYYNSFIYTKLSASPLELLLRGILCNFCVCLAVLTASKLKSESGKLIIMFCVIMTFVVAGFEHCIANMATFTIAFLLLGNVGIGAVLTNMLWVTIGNIIGGALFLALPLKLMAK